MAEYNWNVGREMGVLENLGNVCLLAIITMAVSGIKRKPLAWGKSLLVILALFSIFILLEEMDYGLHYYEYFMDIRADESVSKRNFHNIGKTYLVLMGFADAVIIFLFVIAPFILEKTNNPLFRYLLPGRPYIWLVLSMILISILANGLQATGFAGEDPLKDNAGEFLELLVYYTFMIYFHEIIYKRNFLLSTPGN